jgi:phosphatidylglycerol:prolipoprotein diacylglycerol transferase
MYLPQLSPVAFQIGPLAVHWYGIFMVAAIVGGVWYMLERGGELGESTDRLSTVALWTVVAAVVGARIVFVLANDPQWIWQDPMQIVRVWQGGLAYDGAVGLGILALWYQLREKPLVFNKLADWLVPGMSIAIFMVRIGNIFNHEVLGRMTQLGFGRWPEQLWGSFIGLFLLLRYFWVERHRSVPPGYQFWSAMVYYAILRGLIGETTRDNPLYLIHYLNPHWGIGFTTLMQLFTPPILVFTIYMMRRTWRRSAARLVPDGAVEPKDTSTVAQSGRTLVQVLAGVSAAGGIGFLVGRIPSIGWYLIGAGVVLFAATWGWATRYVHVLHEAPAGYEPTGELYFNPGGPSPVSVWHRGIHRVFVERTQPTAAESTRAERP